MVKRALARNEDADDSSGLGLGNVVASRASVKHIARLESVITDATAFHSLLSALRPLAKHSDEVASLLQEYETTPELSIDAATRADRALMAVAERHRKRADEDVARQKQRALKVEREKAELEAAEKTLLEAEIDAVPPEPVDAATPPVVQHENDPGEMVDDAAPVEYGEEEQQQADEQTEMPYLASQRDGKPAIKRARVDDSDMRQKRCKAFIIASNADTGYRVDAELVFRSTARDACNKFADSVKTLNSELGQFAEISFEVAPASTEDDDAMVHCNLVADPINLLLFQRLISQLLTEADGVDVARISVDPTLGDRKHFGRSVNSLITYLREVAELAGQITANIEMVDEGVVLPPPMQQGEQRELELAMLRLAQHHIIQPLPDRRVELGTVLGLNASHADQSPAFVRAAAFDMSTADVERFAVSLNNIATPLDDILFDLSLKSAALSAAMLSELARLRAEAQGSKDSRALAPLRKAEDRVVALLEAAGSSARDLCFGIGGTWPAKATRGQAMAASRSGLVVRALALLVLLKHVPAIGASGVLFRELTRRIWVGKVGVEHVRIMSAWAAILKDELVPQCHAPNFAVASALDSWRDEVGL